MTDKIRVTADLYQDEYGAVIVTTNDLNGFPPTRLAEGKGAQVARDAIAAGTVARRLPAKGTSEHELFLAAIEVAASAPLNRGSAVSHARVYWPRVQALRNALDGLGIDWRMVHAKYAKQREER